MRSFEGKKVFLFGVGIVAELLESLIETVNVPITIEGYVDNDARKQQTPYKSKIVNDVNVFEKYNKQELLVIITSQSYRAISKQLTEIGLVEHEQYISADIIILEIIHQYPSLRHVYLPRIQGWYKIDDDMESSFLRILGHARNYTMTSTKTMYNLFSAIKYVVDNQIKGDIVECGVWRGGSSMVSALSLLEFNDVSRTLYLYDTYEGMSEASEKDVLYNGMKIKDNIRQFNQEGINNFSSIPGKTSYASIDEVIRNMNSTGYPTNQIKFIKGKVEDTIPSIIPDEISILRLDTDFYESTYHEMVYLFPRLVKGGILIIDDYGYCRGAREAVDQYFKEINYSMHLVKTDYSVRVGLKV